VGIGLQDGSGNFPNSAAATAGRLVGRKNPEDARRANTVSDGEQYVTLGVFAAILLAMMIASLEWIRANGFPHYERSMWFGYVVGILVILFLGGVAYYFREIRRPRPIFYPLVEISVGIAMATQAFRRTSDLPSIMYVVFLLAGLRIVVDGMKRFNDFRIERRAGSLTGGASSRNYEHSG
jgi:hypothetical protein